MTIIVMQTSNVMGRQMGKTGTLRHDDSSATKALRMLEAMNLRVNKREFHLLLNRAAAIMDEYQRLEDKENHVVRHGYGTCI